jgi:2-polyprenyl-3-methyl-5-hydroxy-6-metoxy-1,4-benzoquinol methylase
MPCPICHSSARESVYNLYDDRYGYPGIFSLLRCNQCGHRSLQVKFSPAELRNLYSNYYPRSTYNLDRHQPYPEVTGFGAWLDGSKSATFRWVPRNVRVLDIGCGFGESLGYHRARGCDVYGVEADENIRRVTEKFGYRVHVGLFDPNMYESNFFDFVTMSQVIEHVTEPVATLRGIAKILKPSGTAILSTPNAGGWGAGVFGRRWINWHTPYHLHFFSKQSLYGAAEAAGLKVDRVVTITPSAWLSFQLIHLINYPSLGTPSVFWAPGSSHPCLSHLLFRKLIMATRLILLPQLISRFFDAIGRGDNFIIVLKKI